MAFGHSENSSAEHRLDNSKDVSGQATRLWQRIWQRITHISADTRKTVIPIIAVFGSLLAAPYALRTQKAPSKDREVITSRIFDLRNKLDRTDLHCSRHFENCYVTTMNAKGLAALDGVTIETALNNLSQINGCLNYNDHRKATMESIPPAVADLLADLRDDNEFTMETEAGPIAIEVAYFRNNIHGFMRMVNELSDILDFNLAETGLTDDVIARLERKKQEQRSGHWVASNR